MIHHHPSFVDLTTWPVDVNKLAFSASSKGAMFVGAFAFAFTDLPLPGPLAFGSAEFFLGGIIRIDPKFAAN